MWLRTQWKELNMIFSNRWSILQTLIKGRNCLKDSSRRFPKAKWPLKYSEQWVMETFSSQTIKEFTAKTKRWKNWWRARSLLCNQFQKSLTMKWVSNLPEEDMEILSQNILNSSLRCSLKAKLLKKLSVRSQKKKIGNQMATNH